MTFQSIHPYDQSVIAEYPLLTEQMLEQRIESASRGFEHWRQTSLEERSDLLKRVASVLRAKNEECARLITMEMGKVLPEARAEVEKCAVCCDFYADYGAEYIREEIVGNGSANGMVPKPADMLRGKVRFEPLGAIFAIMPWNFPFWQVFRFAAPSLMAGNVALLKHAPNVVGCALAIERIFTEAGAPSAIFQTLVVDIDVVERIIAHDAVQGITLTGSEFAGSSVAALAGKYIKRSVLELGGSDPLIVLADADLERAAAVAVQSRMQNAGQSCIASKRFLVHSAVHDEFVQLLEQKISVLKQGNPLESTTTTGPMARTSLAEKLAEQVRVTEKQGGKLLVGDTAQFQSGANFTPSLVVNTPHDSPAFREETFGPVAVVVWCSDDDEAVRLANNTQYGLGASVWTRDTERGERLAERINAGAVFVNGLVKSMPHVPFGGIKKSGYGRELSYFGMKEFMNAKTLYIYE
jgi:succinate-semialdehyde dehydrogenase / glutarate-semialdehyde dehydrogenase